eukprot:TRINITY_DN2977_c0_g1_i2.p3 TRINITY_DN2977_c0_g1~~TRINITY_DN2977_c0_g1_i2.p3  ORF type:complete len:125 (-),score=29.47 TRINITY_DN2977_c0_g1_i2:102-476(-)
MRKRGVDVTYEEKTHMFVFCGDTTHRVFEQNSDLFNYPVIVTECSFLEDDLESNAERTKHTLWKHLKPVIVAHPEVTFVLIHFSLRHSNKDILDFFRKQDLPNIIPFVPDHDDDSRRSSVISHP